MLLPENRLVSVSQLWATFCSKHSGDSRSGAVARACLFAR